MNIVEAEPSVGIPRQGRGKYNGGRASCEHSPAEPGNEGNPEIVKIAEKFIFANCYNPHHVGEFLQNYSYY
ncbi:hypothetical protein [Aphanizomenon flos-aquae]|uniref:hypothetical protein n=1 Tax=Aphanizomenon flos-aquae TaxID=1176 RepID=UPI001688A133|nr:hypothetical protein [Aphanizomenon flos-aquae]MBD2556994.1 hypothetical protein [Aphanizomenon flos-aquae FACHB-1290]MBD2643642.1 hypothetical protein [Aphanizomenon sp. FACHB-1401]